MDPTVSTMRLWPFVIGHWSLPAAFCRLPFAFRKGPARGVIYPVLLISILVMGVATAGVAELWST